MIQIRRVDLKQTEIDYLLACSAVTTVLALSIVTGVDPDRAAAATNKLLEDFGKARLALGPGGVQALREKLKRTS